MPLVRISLLRGKPEGFGRKVGAVVYRAMRETLNVPDKDNFQVLTEHTPESLVYDPSYLDIERSDGFIAIQITLNEGRSLDMKKAFYRRVAEDLRRELDVRPQDVFINLVEVKKENWSFGNGIAQYGS
ncbi:MAG TPA: tautomerase family protein [Burkholderiales bacterium]|nr:tautomerase family protein [Burkholderiales bacterium]